MLAGSPPVKQFALINRLLDQADAAHRYAKRFGRAHPLWGNGSLMARARAEAGPRQLGLQSAHFLSALALVASQLAVRKHRAQTK